MDALFIYIFHENQSTFIHLSMQKTCLNPFLIRYNIFLLSYLELKIVFTIKKIPLVEFTRPHID